MNRISIDIDKPFGVREDLTIDYSDEYEFPYSFDYKLNSRGLRTGEFDRYYDVVVAGCSLTYGSGIPEEGRWGNMLSSMSGLSVANISYSGRCTSHIVSNVIKYLAINKPKYMICFFPNFERLTLIENNRISAVNLGYEKLHLRVEDRISNAIPIGLAQQTALNSIRMLEDICILMDIKLLWSTWSLSNLNKQDVLNSFKFYIDDTTRNDFPPYLQWNTWTEDPEQRKNYFIHPDMNCHSDHEMKNSDYFNYGGDSKKRSSQYGHGFCPHPGIHRNIHWAEFFYEKIKDYDNFRN